MKIRAVVAAALCVAVGFAARSSGETKVRVLTYNIRHAEGLDGKVDLDRIAGIIRESRADIVCLQEVDRNLPRTSRADFPALLSEKLKMAVAFDPNYQFDGGDYGNATLSRFDIVSQENIHLPGPPGKEPRGCLKTTLRVGNQNVEVFNAHLGLDSAERKEQAAAILAWIKNPEKLAPGKTPRPMILTGDLNEVRTGPAVSALLEQFKDTAEPEAGKKIDYILVSGPVSVLSSHVFSGRETAVASDHQPWLAELSLVKPPNKAADEGVPDNDDNRVTEAIVEGT